MYYVSELCFAQTLQTGGQPHFFPPITWMWRWKTVCSTRLDAIPSLTGVGTVVDHDTVAIVQLLLHGDNGGHSHQVADELLLVLTHLQA